MRPLLSASVGEAAACRASGGWTTGYRRWLRTLSPSGKAPTTWKPEAAVAVLHNDKLTLFPVLDLPVKTVLCDNRRKVGGD